MCEWFRVRGGHIFGIISFVFIYKFIDNAFLLRFKLKNHTNIYHFQHFQKSNLGDLFRQSSIEHRHQLFIFVSYTHRKDFDPKRSARHVIARQQMAHVSSSDAPLQGILSPTISQHSTCASSFV